MIISLLFLIQCVNQNQAFSLLSLNFLIEWIISLWTCPHVTDKNIFLTEQSRKTCCDGELGLWFPQGRSPAKRSGSYWLLKFISVCVDHCCWDEENNVGILYKFYIIFIIRKSSIHFQYNVALENNWMQIVLNGTKTNRHFLY